MRFDRQQFMNNLNTARQCWGCRFLHIGRDVSHNHCDCRYGDSYWQDHRVNGHYNYPENIYYTTVCRAKK